MSKGALQGFQKLNDLIHLYKPPPSSSDKTHLEIPPRVPRAVPHTQILLVRVDTGNVMWRPDVWQMPMFHPAVLAIKEHVATSSRRGVLLHVFSNGGSHTAVQLAQAYLQSFSTPSTDRPHDLSINAIVFDSCPSPPGYQLGVKAVAMGLPKNIVAQHFGVPMIHAMLGFFVVLHVMGISELFLPKSYREVNELPFLKGDVPRTYIYSKTDAVMREEDILTHAENARAALKDGPSGFLVRTEEFVGSQHVNRVSLDPERYWRIVGETWNQAVKMC